MQNQPLLDKKDFKNLLEEIQKFNRIDVVAQAFQTKYAREVAGEDNDKREKQLDDVNKNLEEVKKAIEGLSKNYTKVNDQVVKKLSAIEKSSLKYNPTSDIKDQRPTTLKEELKSGVAGIKRIGSNVKEFFTSKDKISDVRTPSGDLKAIGEKFKTFGAEIKDVLGTSKDYTVRGGRFAEAYAKSQQDVAAEGKQGSFDVGLTKFNEMEAKEAEIKKLEEEIESSTKQGFKASQDKTKELEKIKSEYSQLDPRNINQIPVEKLKPNVVNPESDNIETPAEKMADAAEDNLKIQEKLLDTTIQSLEQLKIISSSLQGTPTSEPASSKTAPVSAPVSPSQSSSGGGIDVSLERGKKAAGGKKSIGSRIMSGLGTAAKAVGGGLLTAGKVTGGALLSKPALIAGGVALAGYGAYKGYQAIKGAFGGDSKSPPSSTDSGFSIPSGPNSQQEEYERRVQEKLNEYPPGMRDDVGIRKDAEVEVGMEMNYSPRQYRNRTSDALAAQVEPTAPVTQKAGFGDKLKSMFSGVKDSVTGALGTAGAAIGGLKDKVMSTAQYVSEEYNRDISATADEDKLNAEADKRIKEAGVERFSQEANNIREQVREEMFAADPNAFMTSEQMVGSNTTFKQNSESVGKKYEFFKDKMESGITAQKSLFGSSFLGSMFSKEGQRTSQFLSRASDQEVLLANAAELGLGSDLPVDYKKRTSNTLLGERISSGSIFKRDKYKVSNTTTGQDLDVTKDEYKKLEGLVAEGKAEEAQKLFDEINARQAAYVPEEGITPEEQMVAPSRGSSNLAAVKSTSTENAAMKDEMAATSGTTQPIVSNNVSNTSTNNYIPIKGEPRATHRGSALERYNERVAAY